MKRADRSAAGGDELDSLLGAFFKGQMPDPWPAFRPPSVEHLRSAHRNGVAPPADRPIRLLPEPRKDKDTRPRPDPPPAPRWSGARSRLALAAAVLVFAFAALCLPARFTSPGSGLSVGGRTEASKEPFGPLFLPPDSPKPATTAPPKVKSSMSLEQDGEGRTGIKITVEELVPGK
jgi:hypothetical protein